MNARRKCGRDIIVALSMRGLLRNWNGGVVTAVVRLCCHASAVALVMSSALLLLAVQATAQNKAASPLLLPSGIAYDSAGNLFFVDTRRNQVFEVTLAGAMSVVAGTGEQGFDGDGGSALSAQFNAPTAITVGPDGTLYVADTGNQRVRAIGGGEVRTVAGTGVRGTAKEGSPATASALREPGEMAATADGGLLVCDSGNHRVLRIKDGVVRTLAGTGIQGFAGDGGAATAAELDTPSGIAAMTDGRVVIADAHNHRLRIVGTDGIIRTLAGTGARGYSGDGGFATAAQLFLPRGLSVTSAGDIIFADSDNHRVRSISAGGVITTIAGDGFQGAGDDAIASTTVSMDTPRSAAVSRYGAGTFAEAHNRFLREVAVDGKLYVVAAPLVVRVSVVTLQLLQTLTYGDGSGTIIVKSNAAPPQGDVSLVEGNATLNTASLANGSASLGGLGLSAGAHTVTARYGGDGLNPAASSVGAVVNIAARQVVASANAASMIYGTAVPPLAGTVSGILPQDTANVGSSFEPDFTGAGGVLPPVGSYPIGATLSGAGSGNYAVVMAPASGALTVTQAHSTVVMQNPAQTYAGLPLTLTAALGSTTAGVPSGEVDFLEGSTVVAKGIAANGFVTATLLAPSAGVHQLTAAYLGDRNFFGSTSVLSAVTVAAMPDFAVTTNSASVSVQAGLIANYALIVVPSGGPFTGSVNLTVSGLPAGTKASFSPAAVVPGVAGAGVTLSIETPASLVRELPPIFDQTGPWLAMLPLVIVFGWRQNRRMKTLLAMVAGAVLLSCAGCGARTVATSSTVARSFPLVVTGTSTNLAGGVVTHTVSLTLGVR